MNAQVSTAVAMQEELVIKKKNDDYSISLADRRTENLVLEVRGEASACKIEWSTAMFCGVPLEGKVLIEFNYMPNLLDHGNGRLKGSSGTLWLDYAHEAKKRIGKFCIKHQLKIVELICDYPQFQAVAEAV